jgi:hypothetical protein
MANITIPLQLTLPDAVFKSLQKLAGGKEDPTAEIKGWASWCLKSLAFGGMMLTGEQIQTIEKTTGEAVKNQDDILRKLQAGVAREDGQHTVKVSLDPALYPHLEETAQVQGRTPDELLTEIVNYAVTQGWMYEWSPSGGTVMFSDAGMQRLKQHLDKRIVTEADILNLIDGKLAKSA